MGNKFSSKLFENFYFILLLIFSYQTKFSRFHRFPATFNICVFCYQNNSNYVLILFICWNWKLVSECYSEINNYNKVLYRDKQLLLQFMETWGYNLHLKNIQIPAHDSLLYHDVYFFVE